MGMILRNMNSSRVKTGSREYIAKHHSLVKVEPTLNPTLRPRHLAELCALSLIWGCAYLFTRAAVPEFGPAPLIALRMGIALCILLPIVVWRGQWRSLLQNAKWLAVQGTLFTSLSFLLIAWSALSLSAGLSAILSATAPMFGALVAWVFLKEKVQGWRLLGLFLGLLGVAILAWGKVSFKTDASSLRMSLAVLAGLISSMLWGMAANFSRVQLSRIDPVVTTAGTMFAATIVLLPIALWQWQTTSVHHWPSLKACSEALFLGVVCSGLGMLMYFRLLREIGTIPTMSVTFMSPVVAILLGAWYLQEAITVQIVMGCLVVLTGTAMSIGMLKKSNFKKSSPSL
jgi:drug/metabolite transporter (DMT)-like permease